MTEINPDDYLLDPRGRLVPIESIHEIDLLRNQTVNQMIELAKAMQDQMREFKALAFADIAAFVDLSAEKYGVKMGGNKGNISLISYDGRHKVLLAVADNMVFDERLQIAKQMIDTCIRTWTAGSNDYVKALIDQAFQVDKQGNINTYRIFRLISLKIDDADWKKAIEALRDSIQITSTTQYIRFYERTGDSDQFKQISMDIARL